MGGNWVDVAFTAVWWSGGLLVWAVMPREKDEVRPILTGPNVLAALLLGLAFGVGTTFRWAALRWPLVGIVEACFVAAVVLMVAMREDRKAQ